MMAVIILARLEADAIADGCRNVDTSFGHWWTSSHGLMVEKRYGLFYVDFDTQERYLNQLIGTKN